MQKKKKKRKPLILSFCFFPPSFFSEGVVSSVSLIPSGEESKNGKMRRKEGKKILTGVR